MNSDCSPGQRGRPGWSRCQACPSRTSASLACSSQMRTRAGFTWCIPAQRVADQAHGGLVADLPQHPRTRWSGSRDRRNAPSPPAERGRSGAPVGERVHSRGAHRGALVQQQRLHVVSPRSPSEARPMDVAATKLMPRFSSESSGTTTACRSGGDEIMPRTRWREVGAPWSAWRTEAVPPRPPWCCRWR